MDEASDRELTLSAVAIYCKLSDNSGVHTYLLRAYHVLLHTFERVCALVDQRRPAGKRGGGAPQC